MLSHLAQRPGTCPVDIGRNALDCVAVERLVLLAALLLELALLLSGRVLVLLVLGDEVVPEGATRYQRHSQPKTRCECNGRIDG